jgi:cation diffusion facilitator family transporter
MHVLADALTSVLAILGLLGGRFMGWSWMDPAVGIIGALVIAHWSIKLMQQSGGQLLDAREDDSVARSVRARLESAGSSANERVTDLHVWRLGPGHDAVIVSLSSDRPAAPAVYKARLAGLKSLSHVTIEVNGRTSSGDGSPLG